MTEREYTYYKIIVFDKKAEQAKEKPCLGLKKTINP